MLRKSTVVAVAFTLTLAACGGDDGDEASRSTTTEATTTSTAAPGTTATTALATTSTSTSTAGGGFDWLTVKDVPIGRGFTVTKCPGDAPVVCVSRGANEIGIIEFASFPIATLQEVRDALPRGERAALEAHVRDFQETLTKDRVDSCGAGYEVTLEPVEFGRAADGAIVRYGFTGARARESISERTIQWVGIRGDQLIAVTLSAFDPGGCVPSEGEATVAVGRDLFPHVDAAVKANPLPRLRNP